MLSCNSCNIAIYVVILDSKSVNDSSNFLNFSYNKKLHFKHIQIECIPVYIFPLLDILSFYNMLILRYL